MGSSLKRHFTVCGFDVVTAKCSRSQDGEQREFLLDLGYQEEEASCQATGEMAFWVVREMVGRDWTGEESHTRAGSSGWEQADVSMLS